MEHLLIPEKRAALLDQKLLKKLSARLNCRIALEGNDVSIDGDPFSEYNAKNVIQAFGRGFETEKCYKLLNDDIFFQTINIKDIFRSREQLARVKSRVIGSEGRAKEYIESISGADIAVFGGTVSAIGRADELKVAEAGIRILIGGGAHKSAYRAMELEKRKLRDERND
ncbi:MAG: hypothetical protein M1569_00825 [Candidatus Marsarchaeota archaeon]|nr:hypothetical protein [Candidatus Marsarchaeota archaeon]MCL5412931.1 hypothetical protein [Candidatus Marsarchaeota archaeon]